MKFNNLAAKVIYDEPGIFRCQIIERRLFDLDLFNTERAVFPRQAFKRRFDSYRFMIFNDWFHSLEDYDSLITFLKSIGENTFYASCPPPFLVNPVAFTIDATHEQFQQGIRYGNNKENYSKDILTSPASFYYGERDQWAIVLDISNNLVIIGLEATALDDFESVFEGKIFDVQRVIDWWIEGFDRLYKLSPESFHDVAEGEEDTPTLIKRNYGNENL